MNKCAKLAIVSEKTLRSGRGPKKLPPASVAALRDNARLCAGRCLLDPAMMPPIGKVYDHSDRQPDNQSQPGIERQRRHHGKGHQDSHDRSERHMAREMDASARDAAGAESRLPRRL